MTTVRLRSSGPSTVYRNAPRRPDAGSEVHFCPTCGVSVFMKLEALPNMVCVPVGAFGDTGFPRPGKRFWASRRHPWRELPGVERVETQ